jgi:hypothetical protein
MKNKKKEKEPAVLLLKKEKNRPLSGTCVHVESRPENSRSCVNRDDTS